MRWRAGERRGVRWGRREGRGAGAGRLYRKAKQNQKRSGGVRRPPAWVLAMLELQRARAAGSIKRRAGERARRRASLAPKTTGRRACQRRGGCCAPSRRPAAGRRPPWRPAPATPAQQGRGGIKGQLAAARPGLLHLQARRPTCANGGRPSGRHLGMAPVREAVRSTTVSASAATSTAARQGAGAGGGVGGVSRLQFKGLARHAAAAMGLTERGRRLRRRQRKLQLARPLKPAGTAGSRVQGILSEC